MYDFLRTTAIISWHLLTKLGPLRGGRIILRSAWSVIKAKLWYHPTLLSFKRGVACRNCEMHDSDFNTCGTPGDTFRDTSGTLQTNGCWCIVRLANRLPGKACWLRYHGFEQGWPDDLMPKWWQDARKAKT